MYKPDGFFGIFTKSRLAFNIETSPIGLKVERRQRDFTWLRETLLKLYPGVYVNNILINIYYYYNIISIASSFKK